MSLKHCHVGRLARGNDLAYWRCESIWRNGPQRANLKMHFEIGLFGATYPDTLTQIEI